MTKQSNFHLPPVVLLLLGGAVQATAAYPGLHFEPNVGQAGADIRFLSRGEQYMVLLTDSEIRIALPPAGDRAPAWLGMHASGAALPARWQAEEALPGRSHYLRGNDPHQWRRHVPQYRRLRQPDLYPGIDLVLHAERGRPEYDFVIAPQADPARIALRFEGADSLRLEQGRLVLATAGGELIQSAPLAWQDIDGARVPVAAAFRVAAGGTVGFDIGPYDSRHVLLIDPVLEYGSYLGGSGTEFASDIAAANGMIYAFGVSMSVDYPVQDGVQPAIGGDFDAVITKVDPATNTLVYSTYLGGTGAEVNSGRIVVAPNGEAVFGGLTFSADFPQVNPVQAAPLADNVANFSTSYMARLSADGSTLVYSSFNGGGLTPAAVQLGFVDDLRGVAVDAAGNAYYMGNSNWNDYPASFGLPAGRACGASGFSDGYLVRIDPAGVLDYAVCYGANNRTTGRGMALGADGSIYLTGYTRASNFPRVNPFQPVLRGDRDGYIMRLSADATTILYSSYLGGNDQDFPQDIALDSAGNIVVTGGTLSAAFPRANSDQPVYRGPNGSFEVFLTKLNPAGSALVFSTYLGGARDPQRLGETGWGLGIGPDDEIWLSGVTSSRDFPVRNPLPGQGGYRGGDSDTFVALYSPAGQRLSSSLLAGAGTEAFAPRLVSEAGRVYLLSSASSPDMPLVNAYQAAPAGAEDLYLAILSRGSDTDGDGIVDATEDSAPNAGDGNADGVPDSTQPQVASLPGLAEGFFTLSAGGGIALSNTRIENDPSLGSAPGGLDFSLGFLGFTLTGLPAGGGATVELIVHGDLAPQSYWKFGATPDDPAPHWYEFLFDGLTGAVINGNRVSLHYVDGQRGDADLAANGSIADPGGPSLAAQDSDADGVADAADNCSLIANPDQRDSNGDGFGNVCDPDLNDDGVVNFIDLGAFKAVVFSSDPDADFDGNGQVDLVDLAVMKAFFFSSPGPAGRLGR